MYVCVCVFKATTMKDLESLMKFKYNFASEPGTLCSSTNTNLYYPIIQYITSHSVCNLVAI